MELIILIIVIGVVVPNIPFCIKYNKSSYKIVSKKSFFESVFNIGNLGEFLTFTKLEELDRRNKLLINVYLLREDGTTTEVDLVMISVKGIFVFESKNYSGWIFGSEKNRYWTKTLPKNKKYQFFNPIWQNKAHIKALSESLEINDLDVFKSYIVFSERCTLKKIETTSEVHVINRNNLLPTIKSDFKKYDDIFDEKQTHFLFQKLLNKRMLDLDRVSQHIQQVDTIKNK